jgi:hypothetical protein
VSIDAHLVTALDFPAAVATTAHVSRLVIDFGAAFDPDNFFSDSNHEVAE